MSFYSYRVVLCAPVPTGPKTPDFGSCSMSCTRKVFGALRPCLSYMVLLDMRNMFGQKFLSFIGG